MADVGVARQAFTSSVESASGYPAEGQEIGWLSSGNHKGVDQDQYLASRITTGCHNPDSSESFYAPLATNNRALCGAADGLLTAMGISPSTFFH